jgi:hypothetical protein
LSLLRALLGDTDVRKWLVRLEGGMDGAQAMLAMWGRRQLKRCRIFEVVLVERSNNLPTVGCIR